MRRLLMLTMAAGALHAAAIRGTVVENQTGRPLARAIVGARPAPGTRGETVTVRTNSFGAFEIGPVSGGSYVVSPYRRGFAPAQHGQKSWTASGTPITVEESASATITIRLPRFGAIAGTVLDENDVGLPEHEVIAYRNTRPPREAARGITDDRGMYRIHGLEPGVYLIGTGAKRYDDGASFRPTYARETPLVTQAITTEVTLDQQIDKVDVRPAQGPVFTLQVSVVTNPMGLPVTLTVASERGRQKVTSTSRSFELEPGRYELYARATAPAPARGRPGATSRPAVQAAHAMLSLNSDSTATLYTRVVQETSFAFEGVPEQVGNSGALQVLARRKDLAGSDAPEQLTLTDNRAPLGPGAWEVALAPSQAYFTAGFSGPGYSRPADNRVDGWNEIRAEGAPAAVTFTLSPNPGSVSGKVNGGMTPASGAPVFLEPVDIDPSRRVMNVFRTYADMQGRYRFSGLAPGKYRVLSSFEFRAPDETDMANAGAKTVHVGEGKDTEQHLDLYVIR